MGSASPREPAAVYFARMRAECLARAATLAAMIEGSVALTGKRGGMFHLVSRDPCNVGGWRESRFDSDGPRGHTNATSFVDAVKAALDYGADLATLQYVTCDSVDAVAQAAGVSMVPRETAEDKAYINSIVDATHNHR